MKTIVLYTVAPAGDSANDYSQMEQFVSELNRFYEKFNLHVELTAYGMTLPKRKNGQYSVKALQNSLIKQVRESVLFCVIFFCKKDELAADEMNQLMRNLMQQKKAEIVAYFKPNEDMRPVRNDIMRRLVQIDEKTVFSEEDQKRLSNMGKNFLNYGCIRDRENKLKEAEAAYKESLVIQRKLAKANPEMYLPDLSLPYHNLGTLYYRTNRLKEAETMYNEALRTRRQLVQDKGDQYLALLAATGTNMGALYVRTNRLEEAEKIYLEVLGIREKLAEPFGEDEKAALLLADVYSNMGHLYNKMNRLEEAEEKFSAALDIEETFIKKHDESLDLGCLKLENDSEQDKAEKDSEKGSAEKDFEKSSAGTDSGQEKGSGFNRELEKKAAMTSNTLGVLYLKQNRQEEAEDRYLVAYKLYTRLAKEQADEFEPPLAMVCYNLGNIYRNMKQPEEAGRYLDQAYKICSERKDSSAVCKQLYNAMSEAQKEALKKRGEIVRLLEQKAREEQEKGNGAGAIPYYQQAAGLYLEMKKEDYQAKAALLYNELGLLNWDLDQLEQAEASYQTSLELYRKLAQADDSHLPDVAIASYNLGIFYQETRDEEVNDYLREAFEIAGKCLEQSEQCREIYENLENEPLYEDQSDKASNSDSERALKNAGNAGDAENVETTGNGANTENRVNTGDAGKEGKTSSSGGWWKKLWGKK